MPLFSRRQVLQTMAGPVAASAFSGAAIADEYPTRPIRLVIPYAAGGSGDQIGRPWAERMASLLGQTYVENIGGAGGALGCFAVAQSAPDGYSLLLGNVSTEVIAPLTSKNLSTAPCRLLSLLRGSSFESWYSRPRGPIAETWVTYSPDFAQWKCHVSPGSTMTLPGG